MAGHRAKPRETLKFIADMRERAKMKGTNTSPSPWMTRVSGKGTSRIAGDAMTKADQAKMLTEMDPAERTALVRMPYLAFLDPAKQKVKTS